MSKDLGARLVLEEFYQQGRYEQQHGLPISKLCDRKESISASQKGFLQFLVSPMYIALGNFLDSKEFDENLLNNQKNNIHYWEGQAEKEKDKKNMQEIEFKVETNPMYNNFLKTMNTNQSPLTKQILKRSATCF